VERPFPTWQKKKLTRERAEANVLARRNFDFEPHAVTSWLI
jgi:hypothetical protein